MASKLVFVFEVETGRAHSFNDIGYGGRPHTAGFTESVWMNTDDLVSITAYARQLYGPARARLLPASASLAFCRVYQETGGKGIVIPVNLDGGSLVTDVVQIALLCQTNTIGAPAQRRWWIHCIPDSMVVGGEFAPSTSYKNLVKDYFARLAVAFFRGSVQGNLSRIIQITAQGAVTFTAANPFAADQWITIARSTNAQGRRVGGKFKVQSIGPGSNQVLLSGWDKGLCLGGTAYLKTYTLYPINGGQLPTAQRIGTRKIGRPFFLYRGRQSKRQRAG